MQDLSTFSEEVWQEAKRRAEVIRPLAVRKHCSQSLVEEAAQQLGLSVRQVYSLVKRCRSCDGALQALIPAPSGGGKGGTRIDSGPENFVRRLIDEVYLSPQRLSVQAFLREVRRRSELAGLIPPSDSTIRRRLAGLAPEDRLRRGERGRQLTAVSGKTPVPKFPLDALQMDHTKVDVILVDPIDRLPMGRPWLTLAIDVYSRCIAGFHLSLEAPSATSVGLCLVHVATDKTDWLAELDIQAEWPIEGKPGLTDIGFQNFPNSFTTFDYSAGGGDAPYNDGNAQDGLEWERHEKTTGGIQLGRAAKLTSSEIASKSYRSTIPPTIVAMQAAGYEDLIVERQSLKAWTRVQNQAHSLYASTHGLVSGDLFTESGQCPAEAVQPTWQNGNLDLAILAGCSVLDIGNFNGWTNTKGNSPGLRWKAAARPAVAGRAGCMFLGYNATAPLGNPDEPAGSLHGDTRILGFYYDQLSQQSNPNSQEAKAMSWLLANAYMEVRIADDACAITDDYYYFIKTKSFDAANRPIADPHKQSDDGSYTTERTIWRVNKAFWSKLGDSGFNNIPLGATGKTMMRKLPPARMGESGKI